MAKTCLRMGMRLWLAMVIDDGDHSAQDGGREVSNLLAAKTRRNQTGHNLSDFEEEVNTWSTQTSLSLDSIIMRSNTDFELGGHLALRLTHS